MPPSTKHTPSRPRSSADMVIPHSLDAERGLIGSVLLSPTEVLGEVIAAIGSGTDHFYQHAHKVIWAELVAMDAAKVAVDPITLTQQLRDKNHLEEVGGPIYVTDLFTSTPTAGNWQHYLSIVRDKYLLRRLIEVTGEAHTRCLEEPDNVAQVLDDTERAVFAVCDKGVADTARTVKALIPDVFDALEKLRANGGAVSGIATGFREYDRLTSGLHAGEMTILAARPGVGKTAFALNVADHVAVELKKPVGFFSLEMSSQSLVTRMICARAQVDSHRMRTGFLTQTDFPLLTNAAAALTQSVIHIDDMASMPILQLRAKARRMRSRYKVELVIVDYLQLVTDATVRSDDGRQAEVASVSRQLKALAKELGVPVLVLCQLNRDIEKRGDNAEPRLADLRESGSIEQDADVVAFLCRQIEEGAEKRTVQDVKCVIAKQRNGPCGDLKLAYHGQYTRFYNAAKGDNEQ